MKTNQQQNLTCFFLSRSVLSSSDVLLRRCVCGLFDALRTVPVVSMSFASHILRSGEVGWLLDTFGAVPVVAVSITLGGRDAVCALLDLGVVVIPVVVVVVIVIVVIFASSGGLGGNGDGLGDTAFEGERGGWGGLSSLRGSGSAEREKGEESGGGESELHS